MKEDDYEMIWNFLREFFNYEHYKITILNSRKAISNNQSYRTSWKKIASIIYKRELLQGQPLILVHEAANQVLDENSDKEAYIWLDKVINNVERTDGKIDEY